MVHVREPATLSANVISQGQCCTKWGWVASRPTKTNRYTKPDCPAFLRKCYVTAEQEIESGSQIVSLGEKYQTIAKEQIESPPSHD